MRKFTDMTIDDIKKLIASDESRTLELKKTTGELKDGMHSACAFLNTEGGWLIFGVAPSSLKIIGQEVTDKTQQEIAQALAGLEPAVDVRVAYVDVPEYPGNKVIAMHFDGWVWGERPHTFHGCPFYKVESTTKVMSQDMYDERIRAHQPQLYAWERLAADGVTMADLNENLIRNGIRRGIDGGRIPESALYEPTGDILAKWKLLKNGVPTNGAVLLFSDNIDEYPQFTLRMARFVGTDKNRFRDNQRVEGNFFQLLDAGVAFCFKHLSLSGVITNHSMEREEQLEVPYHALREALINALCHRYWERYNLTISIAIYDDRVEIASPGTFPPQITPENIKEPHESFPHNLKVAEALYRMTYLENWGSGAKRIMDACKEQGVEAPTWRSDGGFVTITFKRPIVTKSDTEQREATTKHRSSTDQAPTKYRPSTDQVQKMILSMGDGYMTMSEIMSNIGLKHRPSFRKNYFLPALAEGAIERLYPEQPNHPKQKYRLTESAKEWKNSL
jgi:ATP-dependent DNA helicase RecG